MLGLRTIVVGGYLGAGKTTLINAFLKDPQGVRATVLVNDFGKINIDADLIESHHGDTIALTNGCACCTIGDDLLAAAQQATDVAIPPDVVIVEASGVSHPDRITLSLLGVAALAPARTLVVVNGSTIERNRRDKFIGRLFKDQIAAADYLSLNRSPAGEDVSQCVAGLVSTTGCPALVSDLAKVLSWDCERSLHSGREPSVAEVPAFKTETVDFPAMVERRDVERFLDRLPSQVHRAKGFLQVKQPGGGIQLTHVSWTPGEVQFLPVKAVPETHVGHLVLISPAAAEAEVANQSLCTV